MTDELDPALLARVMSSVRLEARFSMQFKVSRRIRDTETDSHIFEVEPGADLAILQKEITAIARCWKGGFEIGTVYSVERIG